MNVVLAFKLAVLDSSVFKISPLKWTLLCLVSDTHTPYACFWLHSAFTSPRSSYNLYYDFDPFSKNMPPLWGI